MRRLVHWVLRRLAPFRPRRVAATGRWLAETVGEIRRRRSEPRLTVAVDVAALWEPLTGVGWYVLQLVRHLADRDDLRLRLYGPTVVASEDVPPPVVPLPTGPAVEVIRWEVPEASSIPLGLATRLLRRIEPILVAFDGNDVLFAPNYFLPRRFLLARGSRVATVLDLTIRKAPWTMREATVRELDRHLAGTAYRAVRLVTISEAVRLEMIEERLGSPERIRAIHLGPGLLSSVGGGSVPEAVPEDFVLFVGTVEPRKNLAVLLDAWSLDRRRSRCLPPLVVAGKPGWKSGSLADRLATARRSGSAIPLGYVDDEVLAGLYARARVLAFPSLYEGFGLPVVEAMHAGVPVVASDIPVLREVGGDAVVYVPSREPEAWLRAIREVLEEPGLAARLARAGRDRASAFDWAETADATARVLHEAGGRR